MTAKLIHLAHIQLPKKGKTLLLLRERTPHDYGWYIEEEPLIERETAVRGETVEEALQVAASEWKLHSFKTVICGFRYTLPERDECGMNALFHQMKASQKSFNGIYFDENLGHNCIVDNPSRESLNLLKELESQQRL